MCELRPRILAPAAHRERGDHGPAGPAPPRGHPGHRGRRRERPRRVRRRRPRRQNGALPLPLDPHPPFHPLPPALVSPPQPAAHLTTHPRTTQHHPTIPQGHLPTGTFNITCESGSHSTGACLRRYHFIAFTKLAVPQCLTAHGINVVALDTDAAVTGDLLTLLNVRRASELRLPVLL